MTRGACRQDAVHHVDAQRDIVRELFGAAHAHEIPRAALGQQRGYLGGHFTGHFVRLTHSKAADRVARKIEIEELPRTFAAQIGKRGALHDAELPLAEISVTSRAFLEIQSRAACPFGGALQRGFGFLAGRGCFDTFIEDHGNVGPQGELDLRGFFRRKEMFGAIEMGAKAHALIGYFSQFGKAEDLVAAGIREDGARPGHESMEPAKPAHQFVPGTKIEMISICKNDSCAELFERFLGEPLDGRLGAHGHERRRLDRAMRRHPAPATRARRVGPRCFKRKIHLQLNTRE